MIAHVYRYRDRFFLPAVTRTPDGIWLEAEPVEAIGCADAGGLAAALGRVLAAGNPHVPSPGPAAFPRPVLLRHAKARSWGEFERAASLWLIEADGRSVTLIPTARHPDGGYEESRGASVRFAGEDAVARLVDRIREG